MLNAAQKGLAKGLIDFGSARSCEEAGRAIASALDATGIRVSVSRPALLGARAVLAGVSYYMTERDRGHDKGGEHE